MGGLLLFICAAQSMADTRLVELARQGSIDELSGVIENGADVNATLMDGTTALHWAVLDGRLDAVSLLLAHGADPAVEDRYGVAPLYLAARNGSPEMVSMLLEAGADPNYVAHTGETALMTAVRTGRREVIELLLAEGALVGVRDPEYRQSALMLAALENNPEAVDLLLRHGADVNARTRVGPTPAFIHPCKGTGCGSEGVGINRGGVPDRGERAPVKGGMTSLLYAARDGHPRVARLLIDAGADLEQAEGNAITPLLMALLNNQLEVAHLLLDRGANVNVAGFYGRTPLFAAVDYRNLDMNSAEQDAPTDNGVDREPILDMIKRLLEAGADVNARTTERPPQRRWLYSLNDVSWVDFTGQTPFLRAALAGDVTVMRLLLDYGADPHIPTYEGTTPLMAAAGVNWVVDQTYTESDESLMEAVKLCLELGADVNAANSMGLTPLLGAVNRGSNDIIRTLVDHGADLYVKDAVGRTALRWAEGVFLAAVGAQIKPETIALLKELMAENPPEDESTREAGQ